MVRNFSLGYFRGKREIPAVYLGYDEPIMALYFDGRFDRSIGA
jgi:hypothetical protein